MIRNLSRPEAGNVAIVKVSLDRLAKPGGSAGGIHFPTRREHERAAHRVMRRCLLPAARRSLRQRVNIAVRRHQLLDASCLSVYRPDMPHNVYSPATFMIFLFPFVRQTYRKTKGSSPLSP